MGYVYGFDHEHPRPPMELKDLLGGKVPTGRDDSVLVCRCHTASRSRQTPVVRTCQRGGAVGLDAEIAEHSQTRGSHGTPSPATRTNPCWVSVRFGSEILDARHDGHRLEPRSHDRSGRRTRQADQ